MWKLKSKLKRKFRSSKIDCNSNRVDFDALSFDSESAAQPESEQSDTSAAVNGGCHGRAPVPRGTGATGSAASSENSSTLNYSCCYNYNFHINYNVQHRLQEHLGPSPNDNHHHHPRHHHHHQQQQHHDGPVHIHHEDTDGTPYGSTSYMTGVTGSESSAEPARRKRHASCPRKVRPMSSDRAMRLSAGSSASSTKVSSEPGVGTKTFSSGGKSATRCLSTSDLSSYKGSRDRQRRPGVNEGPVRPRSASQRRPGPAGGEGAPSGDYLTICRKLHAVSLEPEATSTDLTDHDRRILNCMVLKRIKELEQLEEAVLAQQCWEQEKAFRKSLLDQQERNYRKAIRQKRTIEMMEVRNRKQRLARLEQQQIEKIQNEISEKDLRSASLLKNIEIKKGIRECERRSRELKRLEDATVNHEEKVLDRDIWRQSLVETLEERASRAEGLRRRVMDVYRRRLKIDNQLEQRMHAHNLQQTLEQERYKLSLLKERILVRESRFQKFKDSKKRIFDQLKNRAKTTAALRDMVKHSIGPSSTAPGSAAGTGRPSSVVQRCGSSARSMVTVAGSIGGIQPHRLLDVVRIN